MIDLALQVPSLLHYLHINNIPKGPQILSSHLTHFGHNPHCLSSRSYTSDILYSPDAVLHLARPYRLRPWTASPSPPSPSHPDPFPPRPRPNSSALLSFPGGEGSSYPDNRSPVGLGAPDSASFDQGSFQALASQLPESRSPALSVAMAPTQREERQGEEGVSRKHSPYRNAKLATLVPEAVASRQSRLLRAPIVKKLVLEEFEVESSFESIIFPSVEELLPALHIFDF